MHSTNRFSLSQVQSRWLQMLQFSLVTWSRGRLYAYCNPVTVFHCTTLCDCRRCLFFAGGGLFAAYWYEAKMYGIVSNPINLPCVISNDLSRMPSVPNKIQAWQIIPLYRSARSITKHTLYVMRLFWLSPTQRTSVSMRNLLFFLVFFFFFNDAAAIVWRMELTSHR